MSVRLKYQQLRQLLALTLILVVWTQSLAAFAAAGKVAAPANLRDPLFPLKYPTSFHAMLMAKEPNAVQNYVGGKCLVAIQNHLKKKNNFFSRVMRDRFTIAVKDYPQEHVRDGEFFHYTDASVVPYIAAQRSFDDLFSYVRTKKQDSEVDLYQWFFYVAGDPESSNFYGRIKMQITVSPDTLVLQNGGDMPGDSSSHKEANQLIESELISADPALASCAGRDYSHQWYNSMLVLLASEANGVGLIAYYGIDNKYAGSSVQGKQWLQVVGPWVFKTMDQVR